MIQNTFVDVDKQESYTGQEPVTLAEAKKHCRVDFTDDDDILTDLLTECRQVIEDFCHISLVPKTITLTIKAQEQLRSIYAQPFQVREQFNEFELPYGPTPAVLSVTSLDSDGLTITTLIPNADYWIAGSAYKTIKISNNFDNNILVYSAGYTTIPGPLKRAILNEIAYRYEMRGEPSNVRATAFTEEGVCQAARILAFPYKRLTSI
jgi:uncharacterized phiE125 gp8 family phage protein